MLNKTQLVASKVAYRLEDEEDYKIDITTILLITSIIVNVIRLIQHCYSSPRSGFVRAKMLTKGDMKDLNRELRRTLGWWKYFRQGEKYREMLCKYVREMEEGEFAEIYKEVWTYDKEVSGGRG